MSKYKVKAGAKEFDSLFIGIHFRKKKVRTLAEEFLTIGITLEQDDDGNNFCILVDGKPSLSLKAEHMRQLIKNLTRALISFEAGEALGAVEE